VKNYKLLIRYDGTKFAGWQVQKNARTIQGEIENALKILLKEDVGLIGSGRTDAGVHAWGQVANFRTFQTLEPFRFLHSLNSILPTQIAILEMKETSEKFHARFDAKERVYLYFITDVKSPFHYKYSYFLPNASELDTIRLNEISREFLGIRDFTSFSKSKSETPNKICDLREFYWSKRGEFIAVKVAADRFLHGMVRALVGTVLALYSDGAYKEKIRKIFEAKERSAAGQSVPSRGLFLFKVKY